ncbi:TPM domain-containing protein [Acholeplasma vituli]|uniref:TPM domain-containing protein n=1 Tax=Paracholeplasma vituli TaxID=69473 RepID=A0ABT2PX78_9MOLU|nr:TPM domain-containing protein [Paracholeplasma vituli]MCU0105569.1 TPM domain-containing protein [Paracholeplasma vituli]
MSRLWKWLFIGLISFFLFACKQNKYPDPTFRYYVNDYADALMQYTERLITAQNAYLYEEYGDIQIVYATFLVEDASEIDKYDRVELFEQWAPGNKETDMGFLVILFIHEYEEDGITFQEILEVQMEPGYGLEEYLTPTEMNIMRDEYLLSDTHYGIIDMKLMQFQYELSNMLYEKVYGEPPIDYDMEEFYDDLMSAPYVQEDTGNTSLLGMLLSILSLNFLGSSFGGSWGVVIILVLLGFGGGFTFIRFKGGGGRSGGRGI